MLDDEDEPLVEPPNEAIASAMTLPVARSGLLS